jgi:hypothetical protein
VPDWCRDAEVEQSSVAGLVDDHVAGRDVAMHDLEPLVRVAQRFRDLRPDLHHLREREWAVFEQLRHRRALDRFHREEVHAVDHTELVHRHEVRVAHLHERVRLLDEQLDEARVACELRKDLLHDELLLEAAGPAQARAIHARHTTARELLIQQVFAEVLELVLRQAGVVRHVRPA